MHGARPDDGTYPPDPDATSPAGGAAPRPAWDREPAVVPAGGRIRREALDPDAVFVVKHLQRMGHEAYLVGGCVRDALLGLEPKDFDVATDAPPNRIKRLFRSAFVIGRRFRLVHVRFPGNKVVETATFRADPGAAGRDPDRADGPIHDDNVFGTAAEDAWRRDFSVNALFYDPVADTVVDYVDGLADLETRTIRALGDPVTRLKEDPVRMIRAAHFAARLGGSLEPRLAEAITACATEIEKASRSRLYVELLKVLGRGCAHPTLHDLYERRVLDGWLPEVVKFLDQPIRWPERGGGTHEAARHGEPADAPPSHRTWNLLGAADAWGLAAHGVPESLMLATLLGPWLLDSFARGPRRGPDVWAHVEETFRPIALRMNVPRKTSWELREILGMQGKLARPDDVPRRRAMVVHRPVFPEALVYLELELRARDQDLALVERWREIADEVWRSSHRPRSPVLEDDAAPGDGTPLDGGPPTDLAADPRDRDEGPLRDDGATGATGFPDDGSPDGRADDGPGGRRRRRRRGGRHRRRDDDGPRASHAADGNTDASGDLGAEAGMDAFVERPFVDDARADDAPPADRSPTHRPSSDGPHGDGPSGDRPAPRRRAAAAPPPPSRSTGRRRPARTRRRRSRAARRSFRPRRAPAPPPPPVVPPRPRRRSRGPRPRGRSPRATNGRSASALTAATASDRGDRL
ncbi:MAG: hypothetical protein U1E39_17085 [Planctomycetota bacterium]